MELTKFNQTKIEILKLYEILEDVHKQLNIDNFVEQLEYSKTALIHDNFNVIVVGEFSRGKSTFINAILGKKILPSSTRPTTTVINKINYGQDPTYTIYFRAESNRRISYQEFQNLIVGNTPDIDCPEEVLCYQKHLEFTSTIEYLNIAYPLPLCKNGIEIIDTPGTNDTDATREEITFKFIPQADVAIFILSATQIFSDSEKEFLKNRILSSDIQKVFFVINFKDRLKSEAEESDIIDYAKTHLEAIVKNPKIYLVSSKDALNFKRSQNGETVEGKRNIIPENLDATGFVELETDLEQYLIDQRANIKFQKYIERGLRICNELELNYIELNKKIILVDNDTLEQKVEAFKPLVTATKNIVASELNRLLESFALSEKVLLTKYRMGLEKIARAAENAVDNYVGELYTENILKAVENIVAPLQLILHNELSDLKKLHLEDEIEFSINKLNNTCDNLVENFKEELGITNPEILEAPLSEMAINDELYQRDINLFKNFMIGGAIIGVIASSHMLVPIVGASFAMFNYFKYEQKGELLKRIKLQINKRYYDNIKGQLQDFKKQYKHDVELLLNILNDEIELKIRIFDEKLKELESEREINEVINKQKYENLELQSQRIQDIRNRLKNLRWI
ncbi:MAG: hypothetical protein ATN31_03020 [Candidatus Epulonipiscioides saccharophilum]|nr:MAG: hypothetical protein ATN31_03020 [Epulopiscium sp. AS2M-Bin001]